MPITRELTDDELKSLDEQGIDSDAYRGQKLTLATDDELQAQQQAAPPSDTNAQPAGKLQTISDTLKAHAGGTLVGGAGAIGASYLLGPEVGIPATLIGGALGAFGGGYVGQKAQSKILGDEEQQKLEEQAQASASENPKIAAATDIISGALASGAKFNLSNIPKALSGDKSAISKIALNSLVNPAINTGINYAATGELPTAKDVATQAVGGALFSEGAQWAHRLSGHVTLPSEPAPEITQSPEKEGGVVLENSIQQPAEEGAQINQPQPEPAPEIATRRTSPLAPTTQDIAQREASSATAAQTLNEQLRNGVGKQPPAEGEVRTEEAFDKTKQPERIPVVPPTEDTSKPPASTSDVTEPPISEEEQRAALEEAGMNKNAPPSQDNGQAARLNELKNIENPTPEQIQERDSLQAKSDDVKNQMMSEFQKLKGQTTTPKETPGDNNTGRTDSLNVANLYDQNLGEHIATGKATVKSSLDIMSKGTSDFAPLAKDLLTTANEQKLNVPVKANLTDRSHYDPVNRRINLNVNAGDQNATWAVMHEIGHALTSNNIPKEFEGLRGEALRNQMDKYLTNKDGDESVKELIRTYYDTTRNLGVYDMLFNDKGVKSNSGMSAFKRGIAGKRDTVDQHLPGLGYQIGDLHEYTDAMLSDRKLQHVMNEMPSGKNDGKSMWSRFVDSISKILKIPVKQGSLLERALKANQDIVSKPMTEEYRTSSAKEAPQSKVNPIPKEDETYSMGRVGRFTRSMIDNIKAINHPAARDVGTAFEKTLNEIQQRYGVTGNKLIDTAERLQLSSKDKEQLQKVFDYENQNNSASPLSMFRNQAQSEFYKVERQVYAESGEYRLANNEPVYRNGQPTKLQQKPYAHPTTPSPKVVDVYKTNTDTAEIARLDKAFIDNATKNYGYSQKAAEDELARWKAGVQGNAQDTGNNMQYYNAARRAQGIPLPKEFARPDLLQNLEAYYHRQAIDNSFYKNVESNPKVWAALGNTTDAWNKPIPPDPTGGIAGNKEVKAQLKEFQGSAGDLSSHNEKAISSLATSLFIASPALEVHKAVSNLVKLASLAENPVQTARMFSRMVTDFQSGIEHAVENGATKLTSRSVTDSLNRDSTMAERMQALAYGVRKISSLGMLTDKWGAGLMQAGAEYTIPLKIQQANKGDTTAQNLLRRLDPDYVKGKTYTPDQVTKLASTLTSYIHGTHDGRTLPSWMSGDSELAGFFKLAHWSVAQTNNFFHDVYTPAVKGDYKPLITSLFGAAIGGYLIKDIREKIQGKQGQIPSLSEVAASDKGLSGNGKLLLYNLIASAQYAGFGGLLSQVAKYPMDFMYKNNPQGATFPLDSVATDLAQTLGHVSSAIANDPNVNYLDLAKAVTAHVLTSNIQLGRIAYNQGINSGFITGQPAEKKMLTDKLESLRRFNMVSGLPYNDQDTSSSNPYMNIEQKKFKSTQDIGEAAKMLPGLINNIIETYHDKPDVMMAKLKSLKEGNDYATMPSVDDMPLSFAKYMAYLTKKDGAQSAQDAMMDYFKHKVVNEAKGELVP